jgi:hypothetical protein
MEFASRWGYEGEVPGLPGSYLHLAKNEGGLEGEVRMGKAQHTFKGADLALAAASVCVALSADLPPDEDLRDAELVKLGKNIDILIATRAAALAKAEESTSSEEDSSEESSDDLEKAGFTAPGKQAEQRAPSGPQGEGFTAPVPTQVARKKPRRAGLKLTQSEATSKCSVCEEPQFRGDRFVGCYCLRDLAKHAEADAVDGGYRLTFDPEFWSKQDVALLVDIVAEGGDREVYDAE